MSYAEKPDEITKDEWVEKLNNLHVQRADMNQLIMNYLVTKGFKEAAKKFQMESGIEPSVNLETLDERIKISEMILKGQQPLPSAPRHKPVPPSATTLD